VLWILDVYPGSPNYDFYPSKIPDFHIPDTTTATKEEREKNLLVPFFVTTKKYHKTGNYFIFELKTKKI
jgi:hypothetical protein